MAYGFSQHKDRIAMRSDLTLMLTHLTRSTQPVEEDWLGSGRDAKSGLDVLLDILTSQTLKGSGNEGMVIGQRKAVCLQNSPLYHLGQMFFQEREVRNRQLEKESAVAQVLESMKQNGHIAPEGMALAEALIRKGKNPPQPQYRYELFGVSFPMTYIWKAGGRPVVYEDSDFAREKLLDEDQHWRIVDTNLEKKEQITDWMHEREWRIQTNAFKFDLAQTFVLLPSPIEYRAFMEDKRQREAKIAESVAGIVVMWPLFY